MDTITFKITVNEVPVFIEASANCYPPTWFSPSAYTRMLNVDAYTSDDSDAEWLAPNTFSPGQWNSICGAAVERLLAPWGNDDSDRLYDLEREGA